MAETPERRLAAIMFTDMVGYSLLAQQNEALALELLGEQQRLLRPVFVRHNGREIKTIGDAFLVEFPSAMEAVRCAVEMQETLVAHNATLPAGRRTELRIGIHVGDVVYQAADLLGDSVNIASRIEPMAAPGGICLSEDVARQIENKLGLPLEKLGPTKLKNIQTPMDLYQVVLPWGQQRVAPRPIRAPGKRVAGPWKLAAWSLGGLALLAVAGSAVWYLSPTTSKPVMRLTMGVAPADQLTGYQ